jgi:hypothetical protein
MKVLIYFLLFFLSVPFSASAAKDEAALPPPTDVLDTPQSRETIQPSDDELNLQEELSPDQSTEVELRVYQRKDGATVEEYSIHGHVYMVRVKPPGNIPAYYLYDSDGDGILEKRLPGGYKPTSPPTWVIKEF